MKKIIIFVIALTMPCIFAGTIYGNGHKITSELWIRAVINTSEKGPIEAVWQRGGKGTTAGGDRIIWGYFYASPDDVSWGSPQNPDVFVKIWFDRNGRVDVNYFFMSVPDIDVYSDYPYDGSPDKRVTATIYKRYVRHYYENGQTYMDYKYEDGNSPSEYSPTGEPYWHSTKTGILISAIIDTAEKGHIDPVWHQGGEGTTAGGHNIVWGYYYASPDDVSWGNENNPDLFVKIWSDASGRTDINFFHVSVPNIEVYSLLPFVDNNTKSGMTVMDNRYVRYEYPMTCSVEEQNEFVYNVMTGTYLWYDKVPKVDYANYASPEELLEDIRYKELDKWSYVTSAEEHYAYMEEGRYVGAGFGFGYDDSGNLRVRYVYRSSPADAAGLKRSDKILEIKGKTVEEIEINNLWNIVFGENKLGATVRLKIEDSEGFIRELNMKKVWVAINSVSHYDILERDGLKIGYLVFNKFLETAREELDKVFVVFNQERIDKLILDLRYNGGGRGDIAQHLASLIAGVHAEGKVFSKSVHNDNFTIWNDTDYFAHAENALDLNSIVFITTGSSCSASELVMNSLKPFIEVVSVGDTTCGKPVGMYGWDFCGMHIAPIEVRLINADDEGGYFDGISPRCYAEDDLTRQFGDAQESSLREALHYIVNGSCIEESEQHTARKSDKPRKTIPLTGFRREIGAF